MKLKFSGVALIITLLRVVSAHLYVRDVECVLCQRVVITINRQVKENRTEEAIKGALEDSCNLFGKSDRPKCNAFADEYSDELIHILIEEDDPSLACTLLGVCVPA